MKKVLLSVCLGLLIAPNANAVPSCGSSLMPAFTANQATQLCKTFGSAVSQSLIPSADNTYDVGSTTFGWRTGYFDTSVITPLVNHATSLALGIGGTAEATLTNDTLTFSGAAANIVGGATSLGIGSTGSTIIKVGGTAEATFTDDALTFAGAAASIVGGATSLTVGSAGSTIISPANDAQRPITFASSSDTALTVKYGDSGTTATQGLTISASTADADDDSTSAICGGGAAGSSRGACAIAYGNETADQGTLDLQAGNAGGSIKLTVAGSTKFTVSNTGTFIGTGTATLGWTVIASGAGVACETACTTPCVFGQNATFGLELCNVAVTGLCVCAGAS